VERALYHTWDALIDAVAEETLIAGGGHHGYRRGFAVRVYGVRAIYSPCYFRELPKLAGPSSAALPFARHRRSGTEMRCQIRSGQSETRKKKLGTTKHTEPRRAAVPGKKKMSSFTMGECPVDNRPREPFRISSILASVVSCNGDANKTNISRPIRERPNHRAETDLRPAPSRI